jgi:hypothetical protein
MKREFPQEPSVLLKVSRERKSRRKLHAGSVVPIRLCGVLLAGGRRPLEENCPINTEGPQRMLFANYPKSERDENEREEKDRNEDERVKVGTVSKDRAGKESDQAHKN